MTNEGRGFPTTICHFSFAIGHLPNFSLRSLRLCGEILGSVRRHRPRPVVAAENSGSMLVDTLPLVVVFRILPAVVTRNRLGGFIGLEPLVERLLALRIGDSSGAAAGEH